MHDLHVGRRGFGLIRLAVLVYFAGASAESFAAGKPEDAMRTLTAALESGQVQSMDLIYFPIRITGDRMTPERLKKEYLYQITIRHLDVTVPGNALLTTLKRTKVVSSNNAADVRWGVTFRLVDGTCRELYLDAFGKLGQIDDVQVSFRGELYDWLRHLTEPLK